MPHFYLSSPLSRRHFLTLAALAPLTNAATTSAAADNLGTNPSEPLLEPWGDVSPDGREAVFATTSQEIYIARTDGSGTRRLVGDNSYQPAYSPDGKTIAFVSAREFLEHGHATYLIAADGNSQPRRLTDTTSRSDAQHFPNWSRDGRQIAVVQASAASGILLPVDGTPATNLGPANIDALIWSPKRNELLAVGRRAGDTRLAPFASGIYRVSADGKTWTLLLDRGLTYPFPPVWSPDGRQIAVTCAGPASTATLYLLTTDGSKPPRCLSPTASTDNAPSWSPDGKEIAFASSGDIWITRADGSKRYNVTRSGGYNSYPRWLPASKTLVFVSRRDPACNLYRIRRDGTDLVQLTRNNNVGRVPSMFR